MRKNQTEMNRGLSKTWAETIHFKMAPAGPKRPVTVANSVTRGNQDNL